MTMCNKSPWHCFVGSTALGLLLGCNTPTLPLPPPSEGQISASLQSDGSSARVLGSATAVEPFALVTCLNIRTGTGSVGTANRAGQFDIVVPAQVGDAIEVWQRIGDDPPSVAIPVR